MKSVLSVALLSLFVLTAPSEAQIVEEFEVASGGLLQVDLETGGAVEIRGWDRNQVRVEAEPRGRGEDSEIEISSTDRGVEVKVERGGKRDHHGSNSKGYKVIVNVPLRFDLEVSTAGGGITIDGVEGTIEGETMGGELQLSNLGGHLEISTMGGSIRLTDSEVDGEVSTMGGKVLLENVVGDVDGSSMGGNVIYKNVQRRSGSSSGDAVVITTMGGAIELGEAPKGAKLDTMGGQIVVDSAGEFVEAKTMGGNIVLREVDGRVVATTMGGDVEVRVVGDPQAVDRPIEISSMGGEISLTVPRNFSMNVEIELAYTKRRAGRYGIVSDFDLKIEEDADWDQGHGDARKVIRGSGSFAGGKNQVTISTVNGNVRLKQGG